MASQRKDIRVRVDWDNDGYLNQPISTSTPINLIPSAAYVEGFRGRSRVLGAGDVVETDIKEVDDIGFTTLVTDFATYGSAEYGASPKSNYPKPSGEDDNVYDNDAVLAANSDIAAVDSVDIEPPIPAPIFRKAVFGGTSVNVDNNDIGVASSATGWMMKCYARVRYTRAAGDSSRVTISGGIDGASISSHRKGTSYYEFSIAESNQLLSGVWSDWVVVWAVTDMHPSDNLLDIGIDAVSVSSVDRLELEYTGVIALPAQEVTLTTEGLTITGGNDYEGVWNSGASRYDLTMQFLGQPDTYRIDLDDTDIIPPIIKGSATFTQVLSTIDGMDMLATLYGDNGTTYVGGEAAKNFTSTGDSLTFHTFLSGSNSSPSDLVAANTLSLELDVEEGAATDGADHQIASLVLTGYSLPTTFWQGDTPIIDSDVPLTLAGGTAHNVSVHLRSSSASDVKVEVFSRNVLTSALTSLVSGTHSLTTSYARIELVVPSQGSEFVPFVRITPVTGTPTLYSKGVQITIGAAIYEFTVGTLGAYDDITPYVLAADWQLGRGSFDEVIAYEGTLDLDLNNDSRIFSPDNVDSPLHGNLEQNRKVLVEIKHQGVWQPMWAGWTSAIEVATGRNRSLQASLSCLQGLYRLREGEFSIAVENDKLLHEVVLDLISRSGWRSAKSPFSFVLNVQALLGVNTYISDIDDLFTTYDVGRNTIETVGYDWGRETAIETALKDVLMSEYAKLMVGRDGGLILHNRLRYINAELSSLGDITLDTSASEAKYTYGEDLLNRIEIVTKAKKEVKGVELWTTPNPVYIRGFDYSIPHYKVTKLIPMHFTFEEGKQRTITGLDAKMADMEITVRHGRTGKVIDSSVWNGQVWAAILGDGGNKYTLQLRNNLANSVTIEVTITGDYLEGGQGQIYIVEDVESQERLGAVHYEVRDVPILSNLEQAQGLAKLDLRRRSQAVGEVKSITFIAHDDDLLSDILSYGLGDILALSEVQSGMSGRYHTIIGESGSYTSGDELIMTYDLARTDENPYPVIGTGKMQGYTNLMPSRDILDAELLPIDHMQHKVVSTLTDAGDRALKVFSYAYGSMLWFGSANPVYMPTFASRDYSYAWYQQSGTSGKTDGNPNVMYSKSWGTENVTGVLKRKIGLSTGGTVALDGLGAYRISMVWKAADGVTLDYTWAADDGVVGATIYNRVYNTNLVTNMQDEDGAGNAGNFVPSEYFSGYPDTHRFEFTGSQGTNIEFFTGDMYLINLEELDHAHLAQSNTYRVEMWAKSDIGKTANLEVVIVEHDPVNGITEHTVALSITEYGNYTGTFVTSATCSRVSVGIRYTGVEYPPVAAYVTGLAIVDNSEASGSLEEYNTILPTALRAYI